MYYTHRDARIQIRLTAEEKAKVEEAASAARQPVAQWVRDRLLMPAPVLQVHMPARQADRTYEPVSE